MKAPFYKNKSIASIESLSRYLSISSAKLLELTREADQFYSLKLILKPNGKIRETYRVGQPLKRLQQKILQRIFYNVEIPTYLQGGIRDRILPRDYVVNASLHSGKRLLLSEDIKNFFPSIRTQHVERMWKHLFQFPNSVAEILTKLTTYCGVVPQGAPTSTYIGNLIFWDLEPQIEAELKERGFYYSRFVDDVAISTDRYVSRKELQAVTENVYRMLLKKGVRPNRKKRSVQTNKKRMILHNLNVNSEKATSNKQKWSQLRAAVKQIEQMVADKPNTDEYKILFASVYGRAMNMSRIQPQRAKKYVDRLAKLKGYCHE